MGPGLSGFGLMYCGLSIEPGPTGSGLGPFQLHFWRSLFTIGQIMGKILFEYLSSLVTIGNFFWRFGQKKFKPSGHTANEINYIDGERVGTSHTNRVGLEVEQARAFH